MRVFAGLLLLLGGVSGWMMLPTVAQENCSSAYPDVCIPPPPPDLDCGDIEHRQFRVLEPDPHRFDGDKDGIGCERR